MQSQNNKKVEPVEIKSSFRDPAGSLYIKEDILYRRVAPVYREHYEHAKNSGLYEALMREDLLIPHREDDEFVLVPQKIPFISYPYEWCFSQLRDAALLTLQIQKRALDFAMTLKDAAAFNVQFRQGKPIFIDTLSFEKYQEGSPWMGYRQFCQHFLAPLSLMAHKDIRFSQLSRIFLDGIPMDLASSLLPWRTFLYPLLLSHIHIHAKSQKKFASKKQLPTCRISRYNLLALLDSLETAVQKLSLRTGSTEWADYYEGKNHSSAEAIKEKASFISECLAAVKPKTVWDFGANTGKFSRLASDKGIETISFDADLMAVEKNYLELKCKKEENLLPLVIDLTNPSPAIGWENKERMSLWERGPADMALALAIIHHLAISNNLPLGKIADLFSQSCRHLVVEFIPKTDSQVKLLLATRKDIFSDYSQATFEKEFSRYFSFIRKKGISGLERVLYFMTKKTHA